MTSGQDLGVILTLNTHVVSFTYIYLSASTNFQITGRKSFWKKKYTVFICSHTKAYATKVDIDLK